MAFVVGIASWYHRDSASVPRTDWIFPVPDGWCLPHLLPLAWILVFDLMWVTLLETLPWTTFINFDSLRPVFQWGSGTSNMEWHISVPERTQRIAQMFSHRMTADEVVVKSCWLTFPGQGLLAYFLLWLTLFEGEPLRCWSEFSKLRKNMYAD